jgi:hypothetical protein
LLDNCEFPFTQLKFTLNTDDYYRPVDVWAETGLYNTPFDQPFHLIMNVAVGASNGYFPDGEGDKPWIDGAQSSMRDFWYANNTWLPTWGVGDEKGLTVKSVKMWQEGKCG